MAGRSMPREDDPRLWLRFPHEDLAVAEGLEQLATDAMRHRWWHAQQAAEKALKAVVLHRHIPFPRRTMCGAGQHAALPIDGRYPHGSSIALASELDLALHAAAELVT